MILPFSRYDLLHSCKESSVCFLASFVALRDARRNSGVAVSEVSHADIDVELKTIALEYLYRGYCYVKLINLYTDHRVWILFT